MAGALAAAPLPSTPEEVLKLPPEFTGADEDEDGYINLQEAEAIPGLSAVFALLDHDQNCGIDLEEYRYIPAAMERSSDPPRSPSDRLVPRGNPPRGPIH
jgi:Ca2+-binding EF-hand superfamily protein